MNNILHYFRNPAPAEPNNSKPTSSLLKSLISNSNQTNQSPYYNQSGEERLRSPQLQTPTFKVFLI